MKKTVNQLKFWIAGAAKSGLAVAKLLKKNGADVFVTDANKISSSIKDELESLSISFEENGHSIDRMLGVADIVVISPSIPLDKPLPIAALKAGIPVVSEIEVASWFLPHDAVVIGITGTNGKSTTTHYATHLAIQAGKRAVACGNYGLPLADAILSQQGFDCFVIELSSYQLETTFSLKTDVSIFLNLQNDHQARYGNLTEYLKAKWRLMGLTKPDGTAIVDESVLQHAIKQGCSLPECHVIVSYGVLESADKTAVTLPAATPAFRILTQGAASLRYLPQQSYGDLAQLPIHHRLKGSVAYTWIEQPHANQTSFTANLIRLHEKRDQVKFEIQRSVLDGRHNQVNILNASLAALLTGANKEHVIAEWEATSSHYSHLAHRLEEIFKKSQFINSQGQTRSVRVINDSKATNVESTLVAVESFSGGIRLLLGGEPKGDSFKAFIPYLDNRIERIYPFGKAGPLITEQLGQSHRVAQPVRHMIDAAQLALDECQNGDVILLSPACASFDEFQNFEHRGEMFRQWAAKQVSSN